ncbi:MAG: glycosyltransferase family 4 protein [Sedimenticola sp.]
MKILYHHRIASKDGQYVHVEEIVNALREQGGEVLLVEPDITGSKNFGESSSLVKQIRRLLPGFVHEIVEFIYCFYDYYRLTKAIKKFKPDFIYERYNLFFPSGIWAKKRFQIPLILEVNAPLYAERSKHDSISLNKLAQWSESYVWSNADFVLPVTRVLAESVVSRKVDSKKITVIPNGINRKHFFSRIDSNEISERYGLEDKLVLGFTGFIREWHRLDRVIDAIYQSGNKKWHLLIVGDGPARIELEKKANDLNVKDRVTITGIVERESIVKYVSTFDIALQPDVVSYASPLKLFEYLALGKAVLAPDKENIREILTDGINALLFEPGNDDDFTDKLLRLCNSDSLRLKLSKGALDLIEDKELYWDSNVERIIEVYNKLEN